MCDFILLKMQIQIRFFRLENDLGEIETSSKNFIASFYLKMCFEETSYHKIPLDLFLEPL